MEEESNLSFLSTGPFLPGVFDGGFMDLRYCDYELPDDIFSNKLKERMVSNRTTMVFTKRVMVSDTESIILGVFDSVTLSVQTGPRDGNIYPSIILPDFDGVDQVWDYYYDFRHGVIRYFPDVAVADPVIPKSKMRKKPVEFYIEDHLLRRGVVLFEPTYQQYEQYNETHAIVAYSSGRSNVIPLESYEKNHDDVIYFDYTNKMFPDDKKKRRVIWMEFNPFNVMSIPNITKPIWNKSHTVLSGFRKVRLKEIKFKFNINSTCYRIHSDVLGQLYERDGMQEYDMCSNFDMSYLFSGRSVSESLRFVSRGSVIEPYIIEKPLVRLSTALHEDPFWHYSSIGPWNHIVKLGVGINYYSCCLTKPFDRDIPCESFLDVTSTFSLINEGNVFMVTNGEISLTQNSRYSNYFVKIRLRDKYFQVWLRDSSGPYQFHFSAMKFQNTARNFFGCVFLPLKTYTFMDAFRSYNTQDSMYSILPYLVPDFEMQKQARVKASTYSYGWAFENDESDD